MLSIFEKLFPCFIVIIKPQHEVLPQSAFLHFYYLPKMAVKDLMIDRQTKNAVISLKEHQGKMPKTYADLEQPNYLKTKNPSQFSL